MWVFWTIISDLNDGAGLAGLWWKMTGRYCDCRDCNLFHQSIGGLAGQEISGRHCRIRISFGMAWLSLMCSNRQ